MVIDYQTAFRLRQRAERHTSPELYERAADAFETLEMPAAAGRCRERAEHYRDASVRNYAETGVYADICQG